MSVRRIFLRRSSASEWASENPILSLGEPGFDYTNEILKIGNGVDQWSALAQFQGPAGQDGQDGADGQDGLSETIDSYTTENLPYNAQLGTIAFDTTYNCPVYFKYGKWYKVSDNSEVADRVIEVYLFSGQSNAGGTGDINNLSNFTQLDGVGTLADTRSHILISNNYGNTNQTPSSLQIGNYQASTHGLEVSFLDGIDHVRSRKQMMVKYSQGGAAISTWSKANSNAETSSGTDNNWDKTIASIDNANSWASTNGYTLDWKGFIWWQGESDAGTASSTHQTALETLISNIRTYLAKPELAVCLVQVDNRSADDSTGTNSVRISAINTIRQAQIDTAQADAYVELINTDPYIDDFAWQASNDPNVWHGVHWASDAHVPIGYDTATRMDDILEDNLSWTLPQTSLWLDADDVSTVTFQDPNAATQKVSEWRDKSGNNYHVQQSTGWRQPAYNLTPINGKNTMQFESARQFTSTVPDPADFRDVYIVAQWEGGDPFTHSTWSYKVLFSGSVSDNANQGIQTGANNRKLYNNNPFFDEIIMNGSSFNIADDILDDLKVPFCINVRCNSYKPLDGFSISRDRSLDGREWTGRIAEIICFGSKLSDDDRHGVEGYLAHKWGLTGNLPTNHPYKNSAP